MVGVPDPDGAVPSRQALDAYATIARKVRAALTRDIAWREEAATAKHEELTWATPYDRSHSATCAWLAYVGRVDALF